MNGSAIAWITYSIRSSDRMNKEWIEIQPHRLKLTSIVPRTTVATVNLAVLLAFFLEQSRLSVFYGAHRGSVFVLVSLGASLRLLEIAYGQRHSPMSIRATLTLGRF